MTTQKYIQMSEFFSTFEKKKTSDFGPSHSNERLIFIFQWMDNILVIFCQIQKIFFFFKLADFTLCLRKEDIYFSAAETVGYFIEYGKKTKKTI